MNLKKYVICVVFSYDSVDHGVVHAQHHCLRPRAGHYQPVLEEDLLPTRPLPLSFQCLHWDHQWHCFLFHSKLFLVMLSLNKLLFNHVIFQSNIPDSDLDDDLSLLPWPQDLAWWHTGEYFSHCHTIKVDFSGIINLFAVGINKELV